MDEKGAVFVNQDTIPGVPEDELDYHQDHSKIIVQEEEDDYQLNDIPMDYGEDGETELTDEEFSFSGFATCRNTLSNYCYSLVHSALNLVYVVDLYRLYYLQIT